MNLMDFFAQIAVLSFLIVYTKNILFLIYLWQLKEYRLDRIIAHFRTSYGKKLLKKPVEIGKWISFVGIILGVFFPFWVSGYVEELNFIGNTAYFLFWFFWIIEVLLSIREAILYRWRMPKLTFKAVFLLIVTVVFATVFLIDIDLTAIAERILFLGPFIDRLTWIFVAILVGLLSIPSIILKKVLIFLAKKKISSLANLKIIGITGSYGKTSTKEFLATILSEKFRVAETPGFVNTDIGVAKAILRDLKPIHEVFVVEMGAYKKREIGVISQMVSPQIGIVTGINEQHLELFGSISETMKTKFELIESLPKDGIAVFNVANNYCQRMADWAKKLPLQVYSYNSQKDIKGMKVFTDHIEFTINGNLALWANLIGEQTAENILAAVCTAKILKMNDQEIKCGVRKIISPQKTMQSVENKYQMKFIDDTFNANPDGVMAALDYMKIFNGQKILVLTPLIELGKEAEKIHRKLGEEIANICDLVLLTNINYCQPFIEGAKKKKKGINIQIVNTQVGTNLIKRNLDKNGVVVFEGKEAGKILNALVKSD